MMVAGQLQTASPATPPFSRIALVTSDNVIKRLFLKK
jgi:hypothetical protein